MKKVVALALAGLVIVSVVCFFPQAAEARDSAGCYRNYGTCRSNAFGLDVGWVRMALLLTVCDVGLGRCLLLA
jgi:hypothetical protein